MKAWAQDANCGWHGCPAVSAPRALSLSALGPLLWLACLSCIRFSIATPRRPRIPARLHCLKQANAPRRSRVSSDHSYAERPLVPYRRRDRYQTPSGFQSFSWKLAVSNAGRPCCSRRFVLKATFSYAFVGVTPGKKAGTTWLGQCACAV